MGAEFALMFGFTLPACKNKKFFAPESVHWAPSPLSRAGSERDFFDVDGFVGAPSGAIEC